MQHQFDYTRVFYTILLLYERCKRCMMQSPKWGERVYRRGIIVQRLYAVVLHSEAIITRIFSLGVLGVSAFL